jgi:hypothetical protein
MKREHRTPDQGHWDLWFGGVRAEGAEGWEWFGADGAGWAGRSSNSSFTEHPYAAAMRATSLAKGSREVRPPPRSQANNVPRVHTTPRLVNRSEASFALSLARCRADFSALANFVLRSML